MAIAADADSTAEQSPNPGPHESSEEARKATDQPDHGEANEGDSDGEEIEDDAEELDGPAAEAAEREMVQVVFRRLSDDPISIRVHDVVIMGNSKTRDALIEAEVAHLLCSAGTVQDLVRAASLAKARLRRLDVFDSVYITLDAGPPELPGTTNVVIEVVEAASPITRSVGCFSKLEEHMGGTSHQRQV